jgi:hypothetical protein
MELGVPYVDHLLDRIHILDAKPEGFSQAKPQGVKEHQHGPHGLRPQSESDAGIELTGHREEGPYL